MPKRKLICALVFVATFMVWHFTFQLARPFIFQFLYFLRAPEWIVFTIIVILPSIIVAEIVFKFFMAQSDSHYKAIQINHEEWSDFDNSEFFHYESELNELGFHKLGEYELTETQLVVSLFVGSDGFCHAAVGKLGKLPIFCIFNCYLEKGWNLQVHNICYGRWSSAVISAFIQDGKIISKALKSKSSHFLYQNFLEWHERVENDLSVGTIKILREDTLLEKTREVNNIRRRHLVFSSMTLGVIRLIWYLLIYPFEWLGDYPKLKKKRMRG